MININVDALERIIEDTLEAFLVTIPTKFINSALNSGMLYDIWINLFGNPNVITLFLILGLMGGAFLLIRANFYSGSLRGGEMF